MKNFIITILLLLSITLPVIAQNQRWEALELTKNNQTYIDTTSIQREINYSGNVYSAWTKMYTNSLFFSLRNPETDLVPDYHMTKWLINCSTKEYAAIEARIYYKNSSVIDNNRYTKLNWEHNIDRGVQNFFRIVCTNQDKY